MSTRFSMGVKNEQADAGQEGRTCLAGPNYQARTGTVKKSFSLFSSPRAGLATIPVLIHMYPAESADHTY